MPQGEIEVPEIGLGRMHTDDLNYDEFVSVWALKTDTTTLDSGRFSLDFSEC